MHIYIYKYDSIHTVYCIHRLVYFRKLPGTGTGYPSEEMGDLAEVGMRENCMRTSKQDHSSLADYDTYITLKQM